MAIVQHAPVDMRGERPLGALLDLEKAQWARLYMQYPGRRSFPILMILPCNLGLVVVMVQAEGLLGVACHTITECVLDDAGWIGSLRGRGCVKQL